MNHAVREYGQVIHGLPYWVSWVPRKAREAGRVFRGRDLEREKAEKPKRFLRLFDHNIHQFAWHVYFFDNRQAGNVFLDIRIGQGLLDRIRLQ